MNQTPIDEALEISLNEDVVLTPVICERFQSPLFRAQPLYENITRGSIAVLCPLIAIYSEVRLPAGALPKSAHRAAFRDQRLCRPGSPGVARRGAGRPRPEPRPDR